MLKHTKQRSIFHNIAQKNQNNARRSDLFKIMELNQKMLLLQWIRKKHKKSMTLSSTTRHQSRDCLTETFARQILLLKKNISRLLNQKSSSNSDLKQLNLKISPTRRLFYAKWEKKSQKSQSILSTRKQKKQFKECLAHKLPNADKKSSFQNKSVSKDESGLLKKKIKKILAQKSNQ